MFPQVRASIQLGWEAAPSALATTSILAVMGSLTPVATLWLAKRLLDLVVTGSSGGHVVRSTIGPVVILLGATTALTRAIATIRSHRQTLLATALELHAERRLLEKIADADIGHFEHPEWHDRTLRANRNLGWRPYLITEALLGLIASSAGLIGVTVLLLQVSPWLAILALGAVVPISVSERGARRSTYDYWRRETTRERLRLYLRDLLTRADSAVEVRAYGLSGHLLARHHCTVQSRISGLRRLQARSAMSQLGTALLSGALAAGAFWLVADRALAGGITPGELALILGAFAAATVQLGGLISSAIELEHNAQFLDDYLSFLALERLLPLHNPPLTLPTNLEEGIRFEGVTFTYPTAQIPSLTDVDLHVRPGEIVALVGENGAGKSTLIKLLLRLYDPQGGTVRVGGVDIRHVDPGELRRRVGVLFQDFVRYELTARDNVAFGRVDHEPNDREVSKALRAACADKLVGDLPLGLDSSVGRLFEGGHDLSGGQWQRLALARLLFRDADIWVFDEPTAGLDAQAEAFVFSHIRQELGQRMAILVSHRFATVRLADRVAVLQGGRISEVGTHDELVAGTGGYARLFALQAGGYR